MSKMNNPFDNDAATINMLSQAQKEGLSRLNNVIESKTLGVLTGEVGSGKSTLLRLLAASLSPTEYQVVYLSSAAMSPKDLYGAILSTLGETPSYGLTKIKQQFREILDLRTSGHSRQIVLFIDESHELPTHTLLELRFLMTHGLAPQAAFPVILAGQAKLRSELRKTVLEAIAQRVRMQYHLSGMNVDECISYVNEHMNRSGITRPVFTTDAIKLIHAVSRGIPRIINLLSAHSLHAAEVNNDNAIEEKHVMAVIADLDKQRGA